MQKLFRFSTSCPKLFLIFKKNAKIRKPTHLSRFRYVQIIDPMEFHFISFLKRKEGKRNSHVVSLFAMTSLQARIRISSTVKAIIEERRRNGGNSCKKSDFLEILLCVDTLSEDEKVSFVLDSLLGGYETTSLLMSMLVFFLHRSPTAVQQLKVKILSIENQFYISISYFISLYWVHATLHALT